MADQEHGLKQELNARQMAMVAVGGSIGTGLLLGSGAAIQVAGPAVLVSYVLSGVPGLPCSKSKSSGLPLMAA